MKLNQLKRKLERRNLRRLARLKFENQRSSGCWMSGL